MHEPPPVSIPEIVPGPLSLRRGFQKSLRPRVLSGSDTAIGIVSFQDILDIGKSLAASREAAAAHNLVLIIFGLCLEG